jgi:flagellar hook-associated protein 1
LGFPHSSCFPPRIAARGADIESIEKASIAMNLIYIGMSGVRAANQSLYATGNNIANVATNGYSRRGVLLSTGLTGGVDASGMIRFNESYKTQQLWQAGGQFGRFYATQSFYDQLEALVGGNPIKGDAQSNDLGMGAFFGALKAATGDPGDTVLRNGVLNAANGMVKQFNNMHAVFGDQVRTVEQQRDASVEQVNGLAKSIAELNGKIATGQASGLDVSALMDQRDMAVDELSRLAGVRVVQQPNGTVDVSMASGQPLVIGKQAGQLEVKRDANGQQTLSLQFGNQTMPLRTSSLGGALRGLAEFEDDVLRPQIEALKTLAVQTADLINDQLTQGYDMAGNPGKPLLKYDAATGLLTLDPDVKPEELGFSSDPKNPGDNGNLLKLIELGSTQIDVPGIGKVALESTFATMMGRVGAASRQNKESLGTAAAVRSQAEQDWLSLSGVDRDEEALNVMRFKEMYNANLKVIAVANELFEATLNSL